MIVPEVADYEVRRELTRVGAYPSLRRLDQLVVTGRLSYVPITTAEWRQAAVLWADARAHGVPTASRDALDADVILAACATTIAQPGDVVIVATMNVGHLAPIATPGYGRRSPEMIPRHFSRSTVTATRYGSDAELEETTSIVAISRSGCGLVQVTANRRTVTPSQSPL